MVWLSLVCVLCVVIIVTLVVKIILMKRDIDAIAADFNEKLNSDTNTLITLSGRDKSVRRLATDINKALKELRRQKMRFEQGDAELKNAVTNISHDLRTPLTAISGYLDLLRQEEKSKEVEKYIDIIKNRTEVLKQLSDELFRYSVITAPDYNDVKEKVSVNAVLEESIVGYYGALRQKGIEPEIIIPSEAVCRTLNRAALARIFSNLIGNAIKYSDGDLRIELTRRGCLSFSNSASNLTEVQVQRLFDRFYTVENAGRSTGLGLSIAKVLVEQINGKISAKFLNGELTIYIELPYTE